MGYGAVSYNYAKKTKDDLLSEVLENYYEIDKRFVKIKEYPTIKIY